ncbi:flagellar motor protein MotB [Capnocytophaga canimorsus]|uniref:Flagellar motor protein MotB n=1 Tax=Capnocytophaga canimorsus TaxID=28188 RepID=A0AAC9Z5B4_9FLAO|nr:flagellar motor protein MotB [Capnocytophaga canimorsus]ATA94918.1 flagellar motor protein MotB [Capnocytophaga canimorsus]ATA94920.1 flagellar motor protein MotB [Capnocytophaga canimorsus]
MFFGLLCFSGSYAQNKDLEKANKLYNSFAYVDAISIYERIARKGFENQELLERLGNSYYFNADYRNALVWYEKLFGNSEYEVSKPEYYYRYAQSLKSAERYEESDAMMNRFIALTEEDNRGTIFEENRNYQQVIAKNSGRMDLHLVDINTEYSEYGTAFYGDKVVFAASNNSLFKPTSYWTGETFYNLYEARRDSIVLSKKSEFSSVLSTKFNESTAVFTADGNTVYFTRNNYINKKVGMDSDNAILLKILKSTKDANGRWSKPVELPFNSNVYSVAHPALSPDEKYLYFASNMRGSRGASDIFRVEILSGGGYGKPENLGENVNTDGRESFPFISKNNVLYFASDGFPGLGGLDIFAAQIRPDGSLGKSVNVGRPANSPDDDFCYVIDSDTRVGFLTSNRSGGVGKDDIYSFYERVPLTFSCTKLMHGVVKDAHTQAVLSDASLTLSGVDFEALDSIQSAQDGTFAFAKEVDCYKPYYYVKGAKEGYETAEVKVLSQTDKDFYCEVLLTPRVIQVTQGDDLAKVFKIENIYFDFDKSNIRYDASVQLAKILEVMQEYPKMKIDVRSHTDSRGSDSYNMALSDRRVKSTIKWLIAKGISADRLTGRGYGESQLTNHCSNGVDCSKEEHQANRRSEFIIVSME